MTLILQFVTVTSSKKHVFLGLLRVLLHK